MRFLPELRGRDMSTRQPCKCLHPVQKKNKDTGAYDAVMVGREKCPICKGMGYTKPCPACDGCGMVNSAVCQKCGGCGKLGCLA